MDLDFEQLLAEHCERERDFDPYQIAEDMVSEMTPGTTPTVSNVINRLHRLGEKITLERIELVQICFGAIVERLTNEKET